jgi:hypothetical protein
MIALNPTLQVAFVIAAMIGLVATPLLVRDVRQIFMGLGKFAKGIYAVVLMVLAGFGFEALGFADIGATLRLTGTVIELIAILILAYGIGLGVVTWLRNGRSVQALASWRCMPQWGPRWATTVLQSSTQFPS